MELADLVRMRNGADELAAQYAPEFQAFMSHVCLMRDMNTQTPDDWAYRNYFDMTLRLAEPRMADLVLPKGYEPMEPRQCFMNAWNLACSAPDDLIYCEGFASTFGSIAMEHAWVEDLDGTVIDPTWVAATADREIRSAIYLGVRYSALFALELSVKTGWSSVMTGDQMIGNPILRRGLKMQNGIAIELNEENHE